MKTRLPLLALAAAALLFTAGCQSVDNRIKEKPDVYGKLDPAAQDKIKQGIIDIGFTEDMVYLALGRPDQKRESIRANGTSTIWIYNTYYDRFDSMPPYGWGGYRRGPYYDPFFRGYPYRMYDRPYFFDSYVEEKEERIRVVFRDGKAVVIEQAKD
jgi:hypothetical protein